LKLFGYFKKKKQHKFFQPSKHLHLNRLSCAKTMSKHFCSIWWTSKHLHSGWKLQNLHLAVTVYCL